MRKTTNRRNSISDNSRDNSLSSDEKENLLKQIMDLDSRSIQELLSKILEKQKTMRIPLSLFDNSVYTANEAIVKYLHENLGMSFKKISVLTAKSNKTVWQLYQNSIKKSGENIRVIEDEFLGIPIEILSDRKLSTLEIIIRYLRDEIGMSFNIIAERLRRDYKTVWTTYRRAKAKYNE